jgi:predicted RNA binding protein YcfA (HicA-like mRNA interferase family)
MKIAAVVKLIESDGWVHTHSGSHRQYRHPTKPGVVTVAGKPRDELHPKTLASILRQAGLKNDTGGTDESSKGGEA